VPGEPKGEPSILVFAMLFVKLRQSLWVKKNRGSTFEGNTMISEILLSFGRVPLKLILERFGHLAMIPRNELSAKRP